MSNRQRILRGMGLPMLAGLFGLLACASVPDSVPRYPQMPAIEPEPEPSVFSAGVDEAPSAGDDTESQSGAAPEPESDDVEGSETESLETEDGTGDA